MQYLTLHKRAFTLLALAALLPLAGCSDAPNVVEAKGTVQHKGQPLAKAVVVFSPKAGQPDAKAAVAITDDSGAFKLETHVNGTHTFVGAVPGEYTVTISKNVPPSGMSEEKYQQLIAADEQRQQRVGYTGEAGVPPRVEIVPPEFSSPTKTKVNATIQPRGGNEFTFTIP